MSGKCIVIIYSNNFFLYVIFTVDYLKIKNETYIMNLYFSI